MRETNAHTGRGFRLILISTLFSFLVNIGFTQSVSTGSFYLSQTPPGNVPEIFPLSVKKGFFAAERIAISADGRDIYYSEIKGYYPNTGESIKKYSYSNGKWTGPVTLFEGFAAPALSVSGDTMYIETNFETFITVKKGSGWTIPERILTGLDSAHYYQTTRNGNYYISSKSGKGSGLSDWCRVLIKGADTTVLSLGRPLNTGRENLDFFVSDDESFMIVTNRPGLGISYRKDDGSWTNPINFGRKIDFGLGSWGPWVTPDNKYLFYSTGTKPDYSDVSVYWVRIDGVIDSLRNAKLNGQGKEIISHSVLFDNPPDSVPVVFGKGIISIEDRYEYGLAISPDYREIYFTAEGPAKGLSVMKRSENDNWTYPETANLRGNNSWEFEAFYNNDGSKLFFSSDVNDTSRLWFASKSETGWGSPVLLDLPINSTPVFWATITRNNTLYYTNLANFQIYKSGITDGRYRTTEKAGLTFGVHPFISPDEDFILFNGKGDIYVAFRSEEGKWSEPVNPGNQINTTEYDETCPSLSPDGKYLFFSRYNDKNGKSDIYWVSSDVIEKIRKKINK